MINGYISIRQTKHLYILTNNDVKVIKIDYTRFENSCYSILKNIRVSSENRVAIEGLSCSRYVLAFPLNGTIENGQVSCEQYCMLNHGWYVECIT